MTEYESRGFLLDDYRLFHLTEPQRGRIDFHYHEFCKLLLLRSGSGGYWVDGQRYALQVGDVVLIASHCVHRPEFEPGVPYERTIIYISPDFLRWGGPHPAAHGEGTAEALRPGGTVGKGDVR